ncbi:DUF3793 family protein [Geomonas sp. Red32]|uniref:DUF3793 family protein n=1 Tax=Geomonas sp. Red32 TaxID=2912856 RepID=UPI00202CD81D|nr:DUF3793 family protein [Geomonas sp. Red32]MCM0080668.1 DUF3793 family protein [Geomonas sp. Red32]
MAKPAPDVLSHASATGQGQSPARSCWQEFSPRFADERECLASFLALECAEVLAGQKPANLLNLSNKRRSCGRNLYLLWKNHGDALLSRSGLSAKVLDDRGHSLLLMFYRPESLQALLDRNPVAALLARAGYPRPLDCRSALSHLQSRVIAGGHDFPHEIGVFLGYPLKDVVCFMGWGKAPFTCQGPWKIFGNPTESLRLAETHRACRCHMSQLLDRGCNPIDCLMASGAAATPGETELFRAA